MRARIVVPPESATVNSSLCRVQPLHLAGEEKRRSEDPCLLVRTLRQLGSAQAACEAQVVADPCARTGLSADRVALHDESIEALGRRVHGGREARRSGADDDHVERPAGIVDLRPHARPVLRELLGPGIHEWSSVGKDDDGHVDTLLGTRPKVLEPLLGVGSVERVRHAVAGEEISQRIAPLRPRVGDDGDLSPAGSVLPAPLLQELRDQAMEELVRRAPRLERVVVDVAERHRVLDRTRRLLVGPSAPRDEERALRMRVEIVNPLEQGLALQLARAAGREHDRHGLALVVQRLELTQRCLGRRAADDAVVAGVPLELVRDPLERLRVLVDREYEGKLGHHAET